MSYVELNKTDFGVMAVQTLRKRSEGYNEQEVKNKKLACKLQVMVGHPTDRKYKDVLSKKLLLG